MFRGVLSVLTVVLFVAVAAPQASARPLTQRAAASTTRDTALIAAVNSVIALFYYASVARLMWMDPVPDGDRTAIRVPASLQAALGLSVVVVVVIGIYPQFFAHLGDVASLVR